MSFTLGAHIAGATVALLAGVVGLSVRKGSLVHRKTGLVFLGSMLVAAISAAFLAYAAGKWLDIFSGLLTVYFVLTAWTTLRPRSRTMDLALLLLGLVTLLGYLGVEWNAMQSGSRRPDVPPGAGYVFATVLALAIIGDLKLIRRGTPAGAARIIRHLWRMCFAFFMATASFFMGRFHLFPEVLQASGVLYVLALAPLVVMGFWFVRGRLKARSVLSG